MGKKSGKIDLKKLNDNENENNDIIRMIKIVGIIALIFAAFYLVFAIYNGEISFGKDKETKKDVEIQNQEILAGSIFNRIENEYYVLMYDFDGDFSIKCNTIYNLYLQKGTLDKMYLVNLGSAFNKKYVADNVNSVNVSSIENLKVVNPTLLKISNGKVVESLTGIDAINNYVKTLFK